MIFVCDAYFIARVKLDYLTLSVNKKSKEKFLVLPNASATLERVKYWEFLIRCQKLAGEIEGRELTVEEFSRKLKTKAGKPYSKDTVRQAFAPDGKPAGRELYESAAKAAGFEFEDCLHTPSLKEPKWKRDALREFAAALVDPFMRDGALEYAEHLREKKRLKRVKTGGRTGKKPG